MLNIADILLEIASFYFSEHGRGISKTKLLKLAYLAEVEYFRRNGERLTNSDWVYYLYGPYLFNYDEVLHESRMGIEKIELPEEKQAEIILPPKGFTSTVELATKMLIQKIVLRFGSLDLKKLLDYVYFETEPMMNADQRFEHLDFSAILPQEYYNVEKLKIPHKKEQAILAALKNKLEARRAKQFKRDPSNL
jgi:uncharacterized phage-associated protein